MATTHGETVGGRFTKEYAAWAHAKQRCNDPKDRGYKNYGGRGIRMCERWANSYEAFLGDMGRCPPDHSLDRIRPNGHYTPGNCRWTTRTTQNRNRRDSIYPEYMGVRKHLSEWAAEFGITRLTLYKRLQHRPFAEIVERHRSGYKNETGYVGVYQDKRTGMWRAQRMVNKVRRYAGEFWTAEEAAEAYEVLGGAMP